MEENSIDLKEAVRIAAQVIGDLYSDVQFRDLLLEEIERSNEVWLVTIGFARQVPDDTPASLIGRPPWRRTYKRVKIDAKTGEFLGMEIREPQTDSSLR